MKNHHSYPTISLGGSDIAALIARGPGALSEIPFGEDGSYRAYLVDADCSIPDHYTPVFRCDHWLRIYDDDGLSYKATADHITIYRAAMRGCIIQLH